jgi:hypothetical protein
MIMVPQCQSVQWREQIHLEATHGILSAYSAFVQFVGVVRDDRGCFRRFARVVTDRVLVVVVVGLVDGIVGFTRLNEHVRDQSELVVSVAEIVILNSDLFILGFSEVIAVLQLVVSIEVLILEPIDLVLIELNRSSIIVELFLIRGRVDTTAANKERRRSLINGHSRSIGCERSSSAAPAT